ncbi:GAF domain-containing protein [bacterium]|nr:GAF domain-containing protein [bacterium]
MTDKPERKFNLKEFRAITHAISTYEEMRLLFQHLVEGLCRTFSIKGSSIMLYDESEKELFRVSSHGLSEEYLKKGSLHMNEEYEDFLKAKTVFYHDLSNDPRVRYAESAAKEGIVSMISIPIKYKDAVVGLLKNYHNDQMSIHEDDLESINILMQQLGVVIQLNGLKNFFEKMRSIMDNLPDHITEG